MSGMLILVPTPIGNLGDISPRAAEALASTVPEALPLSDRWDDLCALALVLGQRR